VGRLDLEEVSYGWIKNSLDLGALKLSENLRDKIRNHPMLEILGPAEELSFDEAGNLVELLVEADKAEALSP
jgi:hypothetical protein